MATEGQGHFYRSGSARHVARRPTPGRHATCSRSIHCSPSPRPAPKALTILVLREGALTVARCLEYDIVAQGQSVDEALRAWAEVFAGQIIIDARAGREPLAQVGPAPERFFELYQRARKLEGTPMRLPDEVPQPWMIAAMHPELRALL